MSAAKVGFLKAAGWTVLLGGALLGTSLVSKQILLTAGYDQEFTRITSGFVAAGIALAVTIALEMLASGRSLGAAIRAVGFVPGNSLQYRLAFYGMVPIALAYLIAVFGLKQSAETNPHVLLLLVKLLISQGIIEEVTFRGFMYRHLRAGRTFWSAAALSGVLFALIHLVNLGKGLSAEVLISVGISIFFGFLLAFPLAMIFELGGASIIGGALLHLAIDSINCFKEIGSPGPSLFMYLGAVFVSMIVVVICGLPYLRRPR